MHTKAIGFFLVSMPQISILFILYKTNSFQGYPLKIKEKKLQKSKLVSYIARSTASGRTTTLLVMR